MAPTLGGGIWDEICGGFRRALGGSAPVAPTLGGRKYFRRMDMRLSEVKEIIEAEVLTGEDMLHMDIGYVFSSDLMSDVLALVVCDTILLTGLTNIQTIRTAEMMDIKCIIYVRGKTPDDQTISLAMDKGICLMNTRNIMFTTCGILYNSGLKGAVIENGR